MERPEFDARVGQGADAYEKLIVASLAKHATEAPSDEDLLAAVRRRLKDHRLVSSGRHLRWRRR